MTINKVKLSVLLVLAAAFGWVIKNPLTLSLFQGQAFSGAATRRVDLAMEETRLQAARGDVGAQFNLGSQLVLQDMTGTSPSFQEAEIWFQMAASQGHPHAQAFLCNIYYRGVMMPKKPEATIRWCQGAAESGNRLSQIWLGSMFERGEGVPHDDVQAHFWYSLAATDISDVTGSGLQKQLERVESRMSSEQLADSQQLVAAWTSKKESQPDVTPPDTPL